VNEERKVALEVMQRYYNGYRFHKNALVEKMLYNTTLPFLPGGIPKGSRISRDGTELEAGRPRTVGRDTKSELSSSFLFSRLTLNLRSSTLLIQFLNILFISLNTHSSLLTHDRIQYTAK
jgi:hypothetical protein